MGKGGESNSGREDGFIIPPVASDNDYSSDPEVWDLVIVGAGVAGCALAFSQGREGRRVLLIERDLTQPDRIVGELLQPGGFLMLKKLGLEHCVEGIDAINVHGYCMFKGGKEAKVAYPVEGYPFEVAGRSFHNGRFVQRLRQAAASVPSVTIRQGTVRKLVNEAGEAWVDGDIVTGVAYRTPDDVLRCARGHLTVACDGMYSGLRSKLSQPSINEPSYFVGLLLRNCRLPYDNYGHVVLAKPSPILFYPISSTEVRCLVDYPGTKLLSVTTGELQRYLSKEVAPQLPKQLRAPFLDAVAGNRIRSMQNKLMPARPLHQPGALLLGDAFNMRHPLTGGGMTVALSDAKLLCDMLSPLPDLRDSLATARQTAAFYTKRKPVSATINTLANALYQVFCYTGTKAHETMQQACFDYLALGGVYSSGPVSLLSGLNPRPSVLVAHFFMVALYGVGRLLLPRPTLKGVYMGVMLLHCACCIILPIIRAEGVRAVFFPVIASQPPMGAAMRRASSRNLLAKAVPASEEGQD